MRQILAPVVSNEEVMPNTWMIRLQATSIAKGAKPGQFLHILCNGDSSHPLRRPLSLHRVTQDGQVSLLFRVVGPGTAWLSHRQRNESIDLIGPLGKGFDIQADSNHLLLVAGGIGIAPLVALVEVALRQGKKVRLLAGAKTSKEILPPGLLPPGIQYLTTTEDGISGGRGLVTQLVTEKELNWAHQVFACGPKSMLRALATLDWPDGSSRSIQVSVEQTIACGVGACLGCAVETKQGFKLACNDGPVFDLEHLK